MYGLGGLSKTYNVLVLGLVPLKLPIVASPSDHARQIACLGDFVAKVKGNFRAIGPFVFSEYMLNGLAMDTDPAIVVPEATARGGSTETCLRPRYTGPT